jgi:F-type H+-transporting ATPase subunit delta
MKTVIVTSAVPLTADLKSQVETLVKSKVTGEFKLHLEVDPQILGGLKIMIDGQLFDATIARKLQEIA